MVRTDLRTEALVAHACEVAGAVTRACGLVLTVIVATLVSVAKAAEPCAPAIAKVVSIQGLVEVRRNAAGGLQDAGWQAAELNSTLCAGDAIRTRESSRADLFLSNETTVRFDQLTTLTLVAPESDRVSLIDLLTGVIHVITRTSRPFKVRTPFVNANVEGTEFLVAVGEDSASVTVYEGRLTADNERGSVAVASSERAIATRNLAPGKEVMVHPRDAVQWALYFPTVFDYSVETAVSQAPAESALRESIELYRGGKLVEAIARLKSVPEGAGSVRLLVYRAGLLLLVGRLDEAGPDIERALALDPRSSDAHSLQAIIAVVRNDKDEALKLANRAVELDPASPAARMALSYAQQARFQIAQALATAHKAVDLDPKNALAWARLAELEMSTGDLDGALDAAKRAAGLNPGLAKTQSVLGFANLVRIDTQAAEQAFQKAIELDEADPLPRLGLGLARIREGHLREGREQIEIATSLDPDHSLIRSYLGKAYYEEKRDKLAGTQFGQAKQLDPSDPTPWLYDAIRKQTENRPVEALQDLEQSIELNDNRAVYRSQLLLDEDQATRQVNQARIYRDLGFEQLALVEAYKSLAADPQNDSAHRLLADAYSDVPRGDITRVSESLQATLRQPTSIPAVDLLLDTDNLFLLRDNGPFRLGTNEFDQLFDRNQVRVQVDGIGGTHQTLGDQTIVSGLADKVGFAASQLHYETNGFGPNEEVRKDIYDAFAQGQVSPDSTVQVDLKRSHLETGQTFNAFDPVNISPTRITQDSNSARLGGRTTFDVQADLIWSAIYENRRRTFEELPGAPFLLTVQDAVRSYTGEVQQLVRFGPSYLIAGVGYLHSDDGQTDQFGDVNNFKSNATDVYAYGHWNSPSHDVSAEIGLAGEFVNFDFEFSNGAFSAPRRRHRVSPKLGFTWTPIAGTTLRAAAFSSVKRPLIGSQTIEPTQVAGFNQFIAGFDKFYGDIDGTVSRRVCLAVDQKFSPMAFAGAELTTRRLKVPFLISTWEDVNWREETARLYGYKTYGPISNSTILSGWQIAMSLEYVFEKIDRTEVYPGPEGIVDVITDRVPVTVRFFNSNGLTVGTSASYVRQRGLLNSGSGGADFRKSDSAWVTDLFVDYRLPRRLGILTIGAKNLLDRSIDLLQTDPALPTEPLGRFIYAKVRFIL